jgi:hypothetical protein
MTIVRIMITYELLQERDSLYEIVSVWTLDRVNMVCCMSKGERN